MKNIIAMLDTVADKLESEGLSKSVGGAAAVILSLLGNVHAGLNQHTVKNEVQTLLINLQEAKTKDALDATYHDLNQYLGKLDAKTGRNEFVILGKELYRDSLKKVGGQG